MKTMRLIPALALVAALAGVSPAPALGPGGWDRLGTRTVSGQVTSALNGDVYDMNTSLPGQLLAGGNFTDAGGVTGANRIASWNGTSWSAVGPLSSFNGNVNAIAVAGGKIYAGGTFTNAGGDPNADFLAEYDGSTWHSFCTNGTPYGGNVLALQVIGNNLFVGGAFQNGAGISSADYLVRCDLTTGTGTSTITDPAHPFSGSVYSLTADSGGTLYAGGFFLNLENNTASDNIARFSGGAWSNLGSGAGPCGCAVDSFVRSLASDGTNVYIGADSNNVAGIPQADHVARWDGASWHAVGSDASGTNGYLPANTSIEGLFTSGSHVYATGTWLDLGGDPTADYLADFDGASWKPVGSNGAGNGALNSIGHDFAVFGGLLHVGGNFTSAGGDSLARFIARYPGVPDNGVTIGKAKKNKDKGTAALKLTVPGPGVLALTGKGAKAVNKQAAGAGKATVKIKAKGNKLDKLKDDGKVTLKVTITYTPDGGFPATTKTKVTLVLKP